MATITVRALDANGDPLCGNGQRNFLSDLNAVAQIIGTRLKLFQGEWWLDTSDGTPVFQSILGAGGGRNIQTMQNLLQQRILGSPYVVDIANIAATYDSVQRVLVFSCTVNTTFGVVTVTNQPGTLANLGS